AQLQMHPLQARCSLTHDACTHHLGASERNHIHVRMAAQQGAHLRPTGHNISTPRGKPISSAISTKSNAAYGVKGEGFNTSVLPASNAGNTFARLSRKGKL